MRILKICIFTVIFFSQLFAQKETTIVKVTPSYYGFSGLMFIPNTNTLASGDWSIGYKTKPGAGEDLTLLPFSVNLLFSPFIEGLEIGLTNTYVYASNRQFGGIPYKGAMDTTNTIIPFIPSIKYRFMPMSSSNFFVSMAFGLGSPYGAYFVLDKFFDLKLLDVMIHTGIGTKLTTYHAFLGTTISLGSRNGQFQRNFPMQLCLEGAWGGSLDQLDEKEEAFLSVSIRHAWTPHLFISAFYRNDQQPSVRNEVIVDEKPTDKMGLGLSLIL